MPIEKNRVGVIGLTQSGKTVFLTSMIDHLRHHDNDRFPLRNKRDKLYRVALKELTPTSQTTPAFPAKSNRRSLQKNKWPKKTTSLSEYHCMLNRSDWLIDHIDLALTDFAGERLADMSLAGREFDDWSDQMLRFFESSKPYAEAMRPYLEALARLNPSDPEAEEDLLEAYRLGLARCVFANLPMVTPSMFALDRHGEMARRDDFPSTESLAEARYCGRSQDEQFAPLPDAWRKVAGAKKLVEEFQERYEQYRDEIVRPLAALFADSEALVVLIDLTWILYAGKGALEATQLLLTMLFRYVNPGLTREDGWRDYLVRKMTLGGYNLRDAQNAILTWVEKVGLSNFIEVGDMMPNVRRIAFVGTKADKVHKADRDKLLALLESLANPLMEAYREKTNLAVDCFLCSAVKSTESLEYPWMLGKPIETVKTQDGRRISTKSGESKEYDVSMVPPEWPKSWQPEDLSYPDVEPVPPTDIDTPPEHLGLHQVVQFLFQQW
jgi:predicted YcjX-like family ATPase